MEDTRKSAEILEEIVEYFVEQGLSQKTEIGWIPEIQLQSYRTVTDLFNKMSDEDEKKDHNISLDVCLMWCMFAGIGGALLWHYDWGEIKDKYLLDALLERSSLDCMDEYVLELLGHPIDTPEGYRLGWEMRTLSRKILSENVEALKKGGESFKEQFKEMAIAMFTYGVAYGLETLGM